MLRTFALVLLLAAMPAAAQPSSPAPGDGGSRQLLSVDDVVREVLAGHPAIAASALTVQSQQHRVEPAGALPDPTLSVAYMGDAAPFRTMANDPSSYRGLSAMQMLPLGGKRKLHRAMARAELHAGQADQLAVTRRLKAEAETAFYDYFYYSRALEVTGRDKARLEQMVETTEARYRVGKATQADVLRAQLEVSMLLQRAAALAQQQETAAAHMNLLMGRAIDAPLPPPADIVRTSLPELAALAPAAQANDPALHKEQAMVERGTLAVSAAHKEYIPDLSVGYMFQQRTGMPDMYGAQFSLNIPVFYKSRQREEETAAKLELSAAEKSREARNLNLAYELKQMHAMAANAAKMLDLYDRAILPQAELALQSSESSYAVGSVDFLTVVTNLTAIHGYEVDYYRQVADYETALARIEALTGDLSQLASEAKQ
jgi:outer membrane protein TolC